MFGFVIEEESGTFVASPEPTQHPHRGYYAGQVAASSERELARWFAWGVEASARLVVAQPEVRRCAAPGSDRPEYAGQGP